VSLSEFKDRVGGVAQSREYVYWLEHAAYIKSVRKLGYRAACLADLEVHQAGYAFYSPETDAKARYWKNFDRRVGRKQAVNRVLLRFALVARPNRRHGWFKPPAPKPTPPTRLGSP